MSSHLKNESVLLSRNGGLVRQEFIRRKTDMMPSGVFKLQARSNDPAVWNKAGDLCELLGLPPEDLVAIVFAAAKTSSAAKYVMMPNALSGPFAIRQILEFYKVDGKELDKDTTSKLRAAILGMTKLNFARAIDPLEPIPDAPAQGDFYRLWSGLRELNSAMYRERFTMDPRFCLHLFTLENGFHTLAAKAILGAPVPELRHKLWPAYADSLLADLPQWRVLQRLKAEDSRIRLFLGWVGMFRRDLHGRK